MREALFQPGGRIAGIEADRLPRRPERLVRALEMAERAGAKGVRVAVERCDLQRPVERAQRARIVARRRPDAALVDQDRRVVLRQAGGDVDDLGSLFEIAGQQPDVGRLRQQRRRRDPRIAWQDGGDPLQPLRRDVVTAAFQQGERGAVIGRHPAPLFGPSRRRLARLRGVAMHEGEAGLVLAGMVDLGERRRGGERETGEEERVAFHMLREAQVASTIKRHSMSASSPFLFCFGLGYTASRIARVLRAEGWRVAGTRRTVEEGGDVDGIVLHAHDGTRPLPPDALGGVTHLLSSVPPDADGDPVLRAGGIAGLTLSDLAWCGYLSTTGVYGDRGGDWVDENTLPAPSTERGARRLAAERAWRDFAEARCVPLDLFRIAGIYGPGRNQLTALRAGRAKRIDKPGQVFSRIHVEDLVAIVHAALAHPSPGRVYNCADEAPVPPGEVIAHAAELLGMAPPPATPFATAELSAMARSFYAESKRVSSSETRATLDLTLRYPSYREGLAALAREEA